jgi:hypothetical protein
MPITTPGGAKGIDGRTYGRYLAGGKRSVPERGRPDAVVQYVVQGAREFLCTASIP